MKAKQVTIRYIFFDILSAIMAWALLFVFRKIGFENFVFSDLTQIFSDANFWWGIVIVPAGWLCLYTIQGSYKNVLRKSRLKEAQDTVVATLIGVVVIFFALMLDDEVGNYRNYYLSALFLFIVHLSLTYLCRVLQTSQIVRSVHERRTGCR